MKTNWTCILIVSAAALTMGSAAYGQSGATEIPFSFRVNGTEMPAGHYSIQRQNPAHNVLLLTDGQNNKMAMGVKAYEEKQGTARLIFSCRDSSGCVLVEAWDSRGVGLEFDKPQRTSAEKERQMVVSLRRPSGE